MSAATIHPDLRAAFRERLLTVLKASTGTVTTIGAAGQTYTRSSGSFLADGFGIGDEVMVNGFTEASNNGRALIDELSATTMKVNRPLVSEAAGDAVQIKAGLWQGRAWEGFTFQPVVGQPYIAETMQPISSIKRTIGRKGTIEHRITGGLTLFYPNGRGTLAIERMAGVLLDHFEPGTPLISGASKAIVQQAEARGSYSDPDWLSRPVIITLLAYTAN